MFDIQPVAMQSEVLRFCNDGSSQHGLKLRSGFKPLHWRPTSAQEQKNDQISRKKTA
ncbi:hypothetical protein [Polaromonas sp.]|uniref:hypothetical protein n=1 Tax=Polaromonas sp. TaxID=1869339 RepID=UPI003BB6DCF9